MTNYQDIANYAKVSTATVSHVINNTRFVESETKQRVINAMKILKYKPNLYARGLAIGKTHTLGLIISDMANPFNSELILGILEAVQKNDYNIFLCNTDYDKNVVLKNIGLLINKKVDGIILATSQIEDLVINEVIENGINFVMIDWAEKNEMFDKVIIDYNQGIKEAIDYLILMGHKKIFFISGPKSTKSSVLRINAFIGAISNYKNKEIYYEIHEADFKLGSGYMAAKNILSGKIIPSAVVCSNDLIAIGAMESFLANGLKIPFDISIIGLDNIKLTEMLIPHITTIDVNLYGIGSKLVEILIKRINNKNLPVQKVTIKSKLIIRDSVAKLE